VTGGEYYFNQSKANVRCGTLYVTFVTPVGSHAT